MKFSQTLPFALALLEPATALVGHSWSVEGVPEDGMREITFPINIANAPHEVGFYFAQQFTFTGQSDVGYTGLQPQVDSTGGSVVHAAFSSFVPGSTSTDANCSDGADGGPGVSCAVNIDGTYANTYHLNVKNSEGTTWVGTLIDSVTGEETHIGSYTLPAITKGIEASQLGFVEYFLGTKECGDLPKTAVTFGNPIVEGLIGTIDVPYEYGDCVGKSAFETHPVEDGVEISVGF
ncbi:uncharacterized protein N7479_000809 [Penicillium vulpinum]|uniref:Ubiquitin 3 binding protein But2 C-terminal domain-containing protein n=1 Tax=Penicillium vulpinum TaxID=29845 RepID=A0A1V6S6Y6_9EURO|nr:uncharacterized protein N7479_000809 [Penicillium vulpinum]KAJ5970891.1 hypothetical protein N7479_000809 [Penicillium vulpinum]OQE09484.1 hypothetical protein PENVUL_c006G08871 [Penicillium vulpinum]